MIREEFEQHRLCAECGKGFEKHRFFDGACPTGSEILLSGFHLSTTRFRPAE